LTENFILANIGSPFGLDGFVKVKSLSGETGHISSLKNAVLRKNGKDKTCIIEKIAFVDDPGTLLVKFAGIESREDAKTLGGASIIGDRTKAASLEDGEFYIEDLKGLQIVFLNSDEYEILGSITDIVEGGGGDLVEVRLVSGELKFVPFRKEFFGEIDIGKGRAVLLEKWILDL